MYPNNRYFGPKLKFVWFYMAFFYFDKFKRIYFKYDNTFL